MSQTSAIAAGLIVAFLVFVVVRGELPCYFEMLGIGTRGQCQGAVSGLITSGNIQVGAGAGPGVTVQAPPIKVGPVIFG